MKSFNSKKGMQANVLVAVILVLISAAILFPVVMNIGSIVTKSADKACSFSLLMSSLTKVAGNVLISPECKHKTYVISDENLTANEPRVEKIFDNPKNFEARDTDYNNQFALIGGGSNEADKKNQATFNEWYLDEFMAEELRKCWEMTGRGSYNLFGEWMSFLDCSKGENTASKDCKDNGFFSTVYNSLIINQEKVPTFCILCSTVNFDNIPKEIGESGEINSLGMWTANNPIPRTKTSYTEYLIYNTHEGNSGQYFADFNIDTPQAIVYFNKQRSTFANSIKLINDKISLVDSDEEQMIQYVGIINYKDIYKECSYLIG